MGTTQSGKLVITRAIQTIIILLVLALTFGQFSNAKNNVVAEVLTQHSINVAVIDSLSVINGGSFPTTTTGPTGSFQDFNFFLLPVANLSLANLAPGGICGSAGCDTVLLNVASNGIQCNLATLTAQQKTDLVSFVGLGRKLIIYDSECSPQDYSWLPFPFTTANPGQMGAYGTMTIVEENTLSSNNPSSLYFIDAEMLSTQSDAVGDMNVMTTFDPNWFLDISGTNYLGVSGPVHTYAKYPAGTDEGLIIYNGLDVDYLSDTPPITTDPYGNLAKIFLQELQQQFKPSNLPSGYTVVGINLTPKTSKPFVGNLHRITALLTDLLGNPQPGIQVTFTITSGPNAEASLACDTVDCKTNSNGQVSISYIGTNGVGTDQVQGCFTNQNSQTICSQQATVNWISNEYVALGDSYSSGEGNPDYEAGTDGPEDYCHRSSQAYPRKLTKDFGLQLKFYACSGADTDNFWTDKRYTEIPQIERPGIETAGLVTMTIGGNDAGFGDVLKACIAQKVTADTLNGPVGNVGLWRGLGTDPSCANYPTFVEKINKQIEGVQTSVYNTYKYLRDKIDPNARLLVANYPHLFPTESSEQGCLYLSPFLTKEVQKFMNDAADQLDIVLATAASNAGVELVDVRPFFTDHTICGKQGAWINGITIDSASPCTQRDPFGNCIIPGIPISGSFHPNASGHSDGYAAAFKAHLDSPAANSQISPLSTPIRLAAETAPAVVVKNLDTQALSSGTAACEGTYQAGQKVLVSGGGFAPGASVQLYVTSPGLAPANEQLVEQLTADASGLVAGTIRIPSNATGFTPAGAQAGLVFIDALGLGPDGAHVDNVAMLGLAPHSSACGTVDPYFQFLPNVSR